MCICAGVLKKADSSPFGKVKDTDQDKLREAYFKISADARKVSASDTRACAVRSRSCHSCQPVKPLTFAGSIAARFLPPTCHIW